METDMIDIIFNKANQSFTVAHDDFTLDQYRFIKIDSQGKIFLFLPKLGENKTPDVMSERFIGELSPRILSQIDGNTAYQMIRTSGWSIAKVSRLSLPL